MNKLEAALSASEEENARLRAALRPFADEADEWAGPELGDEEIPLIVHPNDFPADAFEYNLVNAKFSVGDLFRARAALEGEGQPAPPAAKKEP